MGIGELQEQGPAAPVPGPSEISDGIPIAAGQGYLAGFAGEQYPHRTFGIERSFHQEGVAPGSGLFIVDPSSGGQHLRNGGILHTVHINQEGIFPGMDDFLLQDRERRVVKVDQSALYGQGTVRYALVHHPCDVVESPLQIQTVLKP